VSFTDPFPGLSKPLSDEDLIRALRLDASAELDAISLYGSHKDSTTNVVVKAALDDIINEERIHLGEFERLIEVLTQDEADFMLKGAHEIEQKFPNLRYKPHFLSK
jgi:rubrerythrin